MVIEIAMVILWCIWQIRNNVMWNAKNKPTTFIYQLASDHLSQWQATHVKFVQFPSPLRQHSIQRWKKPLEHFLKCNSDAAVVSTIGSVEYDYNIRNYLGSVLAVIHMCLPDIQNSSIFQALGIRKALNWIEDLCLSNMLVESDALLIANDLNSSYPDSSIIGLNRGRLQDFNIGYLMCFFCFC